MPGHLSKKGKIKSGFLTLFIAVFSGCAWFGEPSEPGLYAVEDGDLQRLNGSREWEMETWGKRANLSPDVSFIVQYPGLLASGLPLEKVIYLKKVAWVRSEINPGGEILPVEGSEWAETSIESLLVPVRLEPYGESQQSVRVIPQQRLEEGLYALHMSLPTGTLNARVGINWPAVDRRVYAAANCVDRYVDNETPYRLCAEQEKVAATEYLRVHLVEPEIREMPGRQSALILRGVVVNTAKNPTPLPPLEATLMSDQGDVIKRWQFSAQALELEPGESARFHSQLMNPPPGASNIHVSVAQAAAPAETPPDPGGLIFP